MLKRVFRLGVFAVVAAAVLGAVRLLRRDHDPLPTVATTPSAPWPPLRDETPAATAPVEPPPVDVAPGDVSDESEPTPVPDAPVPDAPAPEAPVPEVAPADGAPAAVTEPEVSGVPVAASDPAATAGWVEPDADGECPPGFPIKAKMSSKIFHSPGQLNYDRTTPDRCYADAAGAEADGLRAAKR